jgi:PBP1b-binding outer membrane lipoprotein LpoB
MKTKSQYLFVLIILTALILGSCSSAHSPNVTVTSITATPSAQVVPTDLPPSPTAKPAPTEIQPSPTPEFSVPEITMDQMKNPATIVYTVANEAQIAELEKQMLTGPSKLDLAYGRPFRATVVKFGDGSSNVNCTAMSTNRLHRGLP